MRRAVIAALLLVAAPVLAAPPETSIRPEHRPAHAEDAEGPAASPVPRARPDRPAAPPAGTVAQPAAPGMLCGIAGLKGERRAPIQAETNGCGIANPVRLTEVSGVRLSEPADVDCSIAVALDTWVRTVLQPVFDNQVRRLDVAGAYVCRGRNRVAGAKISEHGRGRAIDIRNIVLTNGTSVSVEQHWNRGDAGRRMVEAYKRGCGIFGTTLGPGSDGYHEDHMHFDMPSNRRSPYCR